MNHSIWRYALPLRAPVSLKRGMRMSAREGLLLELISADGRRFWGEVAPLPGFSRETLEDAESWLKRLAGAYTEATEIPDPLDLAEWKFEALDGAPPSVDFALESALVGISGGDSTLETSCDSLALCGLLSGSRGEVLSDAARLREGGYTAVKLKVGRRSVDEDAALVGEVRETLGGVALRLDANRAWSFAEARRFAKLIGASEDSNIEFIEEPLAEPELLREFSETTGLPVALDESLAELKPGDSESREFDFARAFVLKPSLLGYSRAASLAESAREFGAKAIFSSSYESGIGTLALIHLAARHGDGAAGLDTYRRFAEDAVSPSLDLSKPSLDLPEVFGVRRELNHERLERIA